MTARSKMAWIFILPIVVSFGSVLCSAVHADPLDFEQAPMSNVVAKLDRTFGISVVVTGRFNPDTPVSLMVADPAASNARLDAINQLANSLGSDFQKSFVISKVADESIVPDVRVDTGSHVLFEDNTVDAGAAIQKLALLDNSTVSFADPISGSVNLSDTNLQVQDAANQIAQQTHTHWQAVYTLTPRSQTPLVRGRIVDRTTEGQPIVQLPFSTYIAPEPKEDLDTTTPGTDTTGKDAEKTGTAPASGAAAPGTTPAANSDANAYANQYANPYASPYANPYYNPYFTPYYNPAPTSIGNGAVIVTNGYNPFATAPMVIGAP